MPKDSRVLRHMPFVGGDTLSLGTIPDVELPYTEATADADTFVVEMTGISDANETGVGGGLTGADLVLTRVANTVAAASGGFRNVTSYGGFRVTQNFINQMLRGSDYEEFCIMTRVKNFAAFGTGTCYFHYDWSGTSPMYRMFYVNNTTYDSFLVLTLKINTGGEDKMTPVIDGRNYSPVLSGVGLDGWCVIGRKSNVGYVGFKSGSTPPKKLTDMDYYDVDVSLKTVGVLDEEAEAPADYNCQIVGVCVYHPSYAGSWDQGTVVVSKKSIGVPSGLLNLEGLTDDL